jgi:hypothetical protein
MKVLGVRWDRKWLILACLVALSSVSAFICSFIPVFAPAASVLRDYVLLGMAIFIGTLGIAYQEGRKVTIQSRRQSKYCEFCNYNLRGAISKSCPECGANIKLPPNK